MRRKWCIRVLAFRNWLWSARLRAHQSHRRLPMAQHRKTGQEQIQTSVSALTYDMARFLKVPLKSRHLRSA